MTTNPASRKTQNLLSNPNVSLLVHDWSSHRPPTSGRRLSGGSPGPEHRSSLASLLLNLNTAAVSSISATINGTASLVDNGSDEEKFYREAHLENNTFDEGQSFNPSVQAEDGGRGCFVAGEEVRVIVVKIKDVRISDWKGAVRDYVLAEEIAAPQLNGWHILGLAAGKFPYEGVTAVLEKPPRSVNSVELGIPYREPNGLLPNGRYD
ncbi:hypothetical protein CH063_16037 [Colletotrichum higginsianum]|uniref:Uncharacterized protein n=1 Tax=Colletotrichum higginsianum (strain IMI 349063) TaxID=759273 RepID=H1W5N1_COLHI|nr:hypothetical protein CH063_16037 [Colletotrichum higginsianum]